MIAWLRRAWQTHTPVHDPRTRQSEKTAGLRLARQALGALQLLCQLILWIILYGYEALCGNVWQAVVGLFVPFVALWLIWRPISRRGVAKRSLKWSLGLLPCLLLDGYLLLLSSCSLMTDQIPDFPMWIELTTATVMIAATVWLSRDNGVPYGAYTLRYPMLAFFALSTVLLGADVQPQRLWPLWGDGVGLTALTALGGAGAVWGLALIGLTPQPDTSVTKSIQKPGVAFFALLPMALAILWALWLGLISPWRPGEGLTVGQRLTEMSQYSYSALLCELSALFWMLMLPFGLLGTVTAGARLIESVLPKSPRTLWAVLLLTPMTVGVALSPDQPLPFLASILPWRFALSALTGVMLRLASRKESAA